MNLAQLVDPIRMRGPDPLATRRAPRAPMGVVTRENGIVTIGGRVQEQPGGRFSGIRESKGAWDAIRSILGASRAQYMTSEAIFEKLGGAYEKSVYRDALQTLVTHGSVQRNGPEGARYFGLTEKGRSLLKEQQGENSAAGADG